MDSEILRLKQGVHQITEEQQADHDEHDVFEHGDLPLLQALASAKIANR
jgi:hypothetical protein